MISHTLKYFGRTLEPCVGSFSLQLFEALPTNRSRRIGSFALTVSKLGKVLPDFIPGVIFIYQSWTGGHSIIFTFSHLAVEIVT